METHLLQQYAQTYATALSGNMPPDLAFVLLLIPKPDPAKGGMQDAAFISNMPEHAALACAAEVLKSKAAEKMLASGIDPRDLLDLEAAAIEHVREGMAKNRKAAASPVPPVPPVSH